MDTPGAMTSTMDQCAYGLEASEGNDVGTAKKPTRIMTNSIEANKELRLRFPGCPKHIHLFGGKAAKAAVYPRGLFIALTRGVKNQMKNDCDELLRVEILGERNERENQEFNQLGMQEKAEEWRDWDDVSGRGPNGDLVRAARTKEIVVVRQMKVWRWCFENNALLIRDVSPSGQHGMTRTKATTQHLRSGRALLPKSFNVAASSNSSRRLPRSNTSLFCHALQARRIRRSQAV